MILCVSCYRGATNYVTGTGLHVRKPESERKKIVQANQYSVMIELEYNFQIRR